MGEQAPLDIPNQGVTWGHEHCEMYARVDCYYIYAQDGSPAQEMFDMMNLWFPQTPENDADVQAIVDALQRIVARGECSP